MLKNVCVCVCVCTSGKRFIKQEWFHCRDCGFTDREDSGMCQV